MERSTRYEWLVPRYNTRIAANSCISPRIRRYRQGSILSRPSVRYNGYHAAEGKSKHQLYWPFISSNVESRIQPKKENYIPYTFSRALDTGNDWSWLNCIWMISHIHTCICMRTCECRCVYANVGDYFHVCVIRFLYIFIFSAEL